MRHSKSVLRSPLLAWGSLGLLATALFASLSTEPRIESRPPAKPSSPPTEAPEVSPLTPEESNRFLALIARSVDPQDGRIHRMGAQSFFLLGGKVHEWFEQGKHIAQIERDLQLEPQPLPPERLLIEGNLAWLTGDRATAKSKWKQVTTEFFHMEDHALDARLNLSRAALSENRREEAIQTLLPILEKPAPKAFVGEDNSRKSFACQELSDIYLERGDLQNALKYLKLATTKYPRKNAFCGTCEAIEQQYYTDRIETLEFAQRLNIKLEAKPLLLGKSE